MEQLQIVRFDEKTEKKVTNALKKIFDLEDNPMTEEQVLKVESLFRVDVANVCMIEARTTEAKLVLAKFIEKGYEFPYSLPKLEFLGRKDIEIVSRYSEEYLKNIIGLLSVSPSQNGSIEIKINNSYPGQFANQHWKVTLAPRVEQDD